MPLLGTFGSNSIRGVRQQKGGGGSFNSGSNQSNTAGARSGNGFITIEKL